jgi:P4 family phage/plasmid primase-like protien
MSLRLKNTDTVKNIKLYKVKKNAEKVLGNKILCNYDIYNYFILDDYQQFISYIKETTDPKYFYECIHANNCLPLYFDIEIYADKTPHEFQHEYEIISFVKNTVIDIFTGFNIKFIVLESHDINKKSFHIIVRFTKNDQDYYFENATVLKEFVRDNFRHYIDLHNIIDTSVYRDGLFRTIYSTKKDQERYLLKSATHSDDFNDLDAFVGFKENNEFHILDIVSEKSSDDITIIEPEQAYLTDSDIKIIKKFIRSRYNYTSQSIKEIFIDHDLNCIIIVLTDKFCPNIDREHKSNHQYIIIDIYSAKRKCHDLDCKDFKFNEIKKEEYPTSLHKILKNVLKINKKELELIEQTIKECKEYINDNYDDNTTDVVFDHNEMVFRGNVNNQSLISIVNGKCQNCQLEHQITDHGYCLKCKHCNSMFPKNQIIPVDEKYKNLNNFFMNYNQLVNNGTVNININNNYYGEEEFNCDFKIDNIFKDKNLTKLYNQVLDGHKILKISELISKIEVDFRYTGEWYYFNGKIWKMDKESLELKRRMLNLTNNFNKIKNYYENKQVNGNYSDIIKNIKSLINKIYKPGFEEEVIKGAKIYYNDEDFLKNLNSKKHLVPFTNGVYDLLNNSFRVTKKDDYINLTVGFDYDPTVHNPEVYTFLEQVLPSKGVRDYVLKKMSECLNGDIPNTHFLFFIGESGANGKSQILNLMKLTMGEFGEKVEVTLITRKRNNANEANTEKIKLMNKRFAFLSEPEDGEKINIGLLKELTGSEEVVARGLYESAQSFIMEAKLFLACNELPEIKGEDQALWRRIRAIDFPSRFVDEPTKPNEYKIDRSLPSRMREDVTWRQTFINILIDYYFKDKVYEPEEIKVRTNEYRQTNNTVESWLDDNIIFSEGNILNVKELHAMMFPNQKIANVKKNKITKEVEAWITRRFPNIDSVCKESQYNSTRYKGWVHLGFKEEF